jgi:hypothetical protein
MAYLFFLNYDSFSFSYQLWTIYLSIYYIIGEVATSLHYDA